MKCSAFSSVSSLARVASFWLALCFTLVQVPATAQSTTQEPAQQVGKQSSVMGFDEALKQARDLVIASLASFDQARAEAETWQLDSEKWQTEALALSSELTKERTDSEALSKSLTDSSNREAALKQAADELANANAVAITTARKERDDARAMEIWVGLGGATVGALIALCVKAIF